MRPTSFVAWLFVMAAACIVIAIGDRSGSWLIGGLVLFSVAMFARHKLKQESQLGRGPARVGFVGLAMLVMLAAMSFLFWLQVSA